ncbi:N4-gp56 family major capsid protein, partial [Streptococcus pneumoniae]
FFYEWTKESLDFDTDSELQSHLTRESLNGASEMTEDALQIDLLNAAGTVKFAGNATSNITMNAGDLISYSDIMRLGIDLDNNRTPKN